MLRAGNALPCKVAVRRPHTFHDTQAGSTPAVMIEYDEPGERIEMPTLDGPCGSLHVEIALVFLLISHVLVLALRKTGTHFLRPSHANAPTLGSPSLCK